jgi:hypothetical protein
MGEIEWRKLRQKRSTVSPYSRRPEVRKADSKFRLLELIKRIPTHTNR